MKPWGLRRIQEITTSHMVFFRLNCRSPRVGYAFVLTLNRVSPFQLAGAEAPRLPTAQQRSKQADGWEVRFQQVHFSGTQQQR